MKRDKANEQKRKNKARTLQNLVRVCRKGDPKRKKLKKKEQVAEPKLTVDKELEEIETVPEEEQNVVFKPNEGTSNRVSCKEEKEKFYMVVQQVVANPLQC